MKQFLVLMTDLALAPLQGEPPRGGYTEDFDDLTAAKRAFEQGKEKWDRASIFRHHDNGEIERIEQYRKPVNQAGVQLRKVGEKSSCSE
jgi:hypothetical protein